MLDYPKTKEEAQKVRYGSWAGNPNGYPYLHELCAMEVQDHSGFRFHQCSRKNGYGPDALYCKQHAKQFPAAEVK